MTQSKTSGAKRPAEDRKPAVSANGEVPPADPKVRFRAVMRQAAAARAEGTEAADAVNGGRVAEDTPDPADLAPVKALPAKALRRAPKAAAAKATGSATSMRRASAKSRAKAGRPSVAPVRPFQADPMTACCRSGAALVEGLQASGALWGAFAKANVDRGVEAVYALMTAKSVREMMEVQKGWTASSIDAAFTQGLRLSNVALDTTRKAADPMAEGVDAAVGETKDRISA
jgi:hypothetical protein